MPCYNMCSTLHTHSVLLTLRSCRQHIDQIMSSHGRQIMQAVTLILEAEHSIEVKEQVSHTSYCCWNNTVQVSDWGQSLLR